MRKLILITASTLALALAACDSDEHFAQNNTVTSETEIVGTDRCGEPIYKGKRPVNPDDGTPCK